ncbi:hypothetical protein VQ056_12095 [Paenibacillus sp. JTLBN-2024]|nr:hypothetical protein CM49_06569 [Paenibacillus sp. P1XP2]
MSRRGFKKAIGMILIFSMFCSLVIALPPAAKAAGTTYYVDSLGGDDGNSGTSENSAWKSLDKVNATTFAPGDKILFKAGEAGMEDYGLKAPGNMGTRSSSTCTAPAASR